MVTLDDLYAEHRAATKRLKEATDGGWRDAIPSERERLREIEYVLVSKLLSPEVSERLLEIAGHLDVGDIPPGYGFSFPRSPT